MAPEYGKWYHAIKGIYQDTKDNKLTINGLVKILILEGNLGPLNDKEIKQTLKTMATFGYISIKRGSVTPITEHPQ